MGWSNQIPPQIQTLQDGTTQFSGPIVVVDNTGKTVASLDISGGVNGKAANFDSLLVRGVDVGASINASAQGLVAAELLGSNSFTVNNGTPALVAITNAFPTISGRTYTMQSSATRAQISGGASSGEIWVFQLVQYTVYPTASNYLTNQNAQVLDGVVIDVPSGVTDITIPAMFSVGTPPTNAINYVGFYFYRASGTGSVFINGQSGTSPLFIAAYDSGISISRSNGIYNPIPYGGGGAPPAPGVQHNVNYGATWSQSYDSSEAGGGAWTGGTTEMYQGYIAGAGGYGHGNYARSAFNFDYATIGGNVSGASNISGTLFIHNAHSWFNGGTLYNIYSQNTRVGSAPGNFSSIAGLTLQFNAVPSPNPGWFSVDISSLIPAFGTNTLTGFALQAVTNDLNYYGYCDGATTGFNPFINVKWTK